MKHLYLLATTENKVRWYNFDMHTSARPIAFSLTTELDLSSAPTFPNKDAAKQAAQLLGLKTWRYVRI